MRSGGGRVLGIDPGRVRFGLALSDPTGRVAQALPTMGSFGRSRDVEELAALVEQREIREIVVGRPLNLDGTASRMTEFAERLAEDLRERTGLPVSLWDERLSSAQAERALLSAGARRSERKQRRDQVAAVLILQGFLDRRSLDEST